MKTLLIIFLCLAGLSVSHPVRSQTPDELKRISTMIVQAKPQAEIMKSWETLVKRYPKMDVNKTITTILTSAKQENDKNKSSQSYDAAAALISRMQKQMYDDAMRILANLKS